MGKTLLAGLPKTGKTTYLALLYSALLEGRRTASYMSQFDGDRVYLNQIQRRLFDCAEAKHTEAGNNEGLSLTVLRGEASVDLAIPDLSGETWQRALEEREWSAEVDVHVQGANGVCVFIHIGEHRDDPTIIEATRAQRAVGEQMEEGQVAESVGTSTQVALVELIQLLNQQRPSRGRLRVSLILSAFDLADVGQTPRSWLEANCPLAVQYFDSNLEFLELAIFGVSAQGGPLSNRDQLLTMDPIDRAVVVDFEGVPTMVDAPIWWSSGYE